MDFKKPPARLQDMSDEGIKKKRPGSRQPRGAEPIEAVAKRSKLKLFLVTLGDTNNVPLSCKASGFSYREYRRLIAEDEDFKKLVNEAREHYLDVLEGVASEAAVKGIEKPVIFKGAIRDSYHELNPQHLQFMLRAHLPEKYNVDRVRHEITGKNGDPIEIREMSNADLDARIAALTEYLERSDNVEG